MPNFSRHIVTLYHFTDRSNLQSIKSAGGILSWADLQEQGINVPCPGGNDLSHDLDAQFDGHRYVHLCFLNEHPMEFRAREQKRLLDPVFLKIHPSILEIPGVKYSCDVSNKSGVKLIDREEANSLFDFDVLHGRPDFRVPEIMERVKAARRYEALIPSKVPLRFITNFKTLFQ